MGELTGLAWLVQRIKDGRVMNPLDEMDISIIRGLANNGMSIPKTAKATYMAQNTARNRIKRIKEKTGCDPLDFYGLCRLLDMVMKIEKEGEHGND